MTGVAGPSREEVADARVSIAVDACSIVGGGLTHLRGVFEHGEPERAGIGRIRIWAPSRILEQLPERAWLERISAPRLEGGRLGRILWQRFSMARAVEGCDLFWSPGGFVPSRIEPYVTMAQNSLLYDRREKARYGWTPMRLRLELLRWSQIRTISTATGVIFLTGWGEQLVRDAVDVHGATCIAPHGIDARFRGEPRVQRPASDYSRHDPIRLVYVSMIDMYKHQWAVAEAIAELRRRGVPVEITFAGPAYAPALRRFEAVRHAADPEHTFLHYVGPVPYGDLPELYRRSDLCVFASSCENLPNVLLEAMATGIPIACSGMSPMKEVIQDAGMLFDPESAESIASAVTRLIDDPELRSRCARRATELAAPYTWERCAEQTFAFLGEVARARRR